MPTIHILLAEDEPQLAQILQETLASENFDITTVGDGIEALQRYEQERPDILVVDVMMPRMDGFELVRRIRRNDQQTPVLFLTARSSIDDVVKGFELGANDYLKKPFGMRELIVRIRALVSRATPSTPSLPSPNTFSIGHYLFHVTEQRLVHVPSGQTSELSHREAEILRALCLHRGEVVESRDLLLTLWGDDSIWNARSLHVFITKLRHRLQQDSALRLVNVRGIGYKLLE